MLTMIELAERVEAMTVPYHDELLDMAVAEALGWQCRLVSGFGLNGRTRGSDFWFAPGAPYGAKGTRRPPRLTGPRRRKATAASLRALANREDSAK